MIDSVRARSRRRRGMWFSRSAHCRCVVTRTGHRWAADLGWNLQSLGVNEGRDSPDSFAIRIQDMRIAIYSLTESSARQAKAALEQVSTNVTVDTNADHGGTSRLRALAENADLFVMAWLSAKHAATDFIREHRGSRPLIYAQGRGFSSILRAIEDHIGGVSASGP